MKRCSKCNIERPLEEFYKASKQSGYRDGKYPWCRECASAYGKQYYARTRERTLARKRLRTYGITQEQFDAMCAEQGGRCLVCNEVEPLRIDHCHATGRNRGLLCHGCNTALGLLKENPGRIRALAAYAEQQGGDAK